MRHRFAAALVSLIVVISGTGFHAKAGAQESVPTDAAPVKEIFFRDFLRKPVGPRGIELSDTLLSANGQTVRLAGYMVQQEKAPAGRLFLAPQPVQMSQHAEGEADDLPASTVLVVLDESQQDWVVAHARGLVAVQGVLQVGRVEATDGRVSWVRLQSGPDALRAMNSYEVLSYLHSQLHRH